MMRRYVTVALSGDGGDEAFGGYDLYWQIARIARWQVLPGYAWRQGSVLLKLLARFGIVRDHLPQRAREIAGADDTSIIQDLFCWVRDEEHKALCHSEDILPVRRFFEPQWEYCLPRLSRLERLSLQTTEVNTRLVLPNDFLFKVDTASMMESLEVRVPMLDEELFAFGLSLPHYLKVNGRTCKRVLRAIAARKLPARVAKKPKMGFAIPVDAWVDMDFRDNLRDALLGPSSTLPEFFRPQVYRPIAHEIGHSLFADCSETIRYRSKGLEQNSWELEFLCNVAAAEILLPYAKFYKDANEIPLTMDGLKYIAEKYKASLESVFIRLCEVIDKPCMVMISQFNEKSLLEMQYMVKSDTCLLKEIKEFIVPKDSKAYECIKAGWTSYQIENWKMLKI